MASPFRALALLVLVASTAACAAVPFSSSAPVRVGPGQICEFDGQLYRLVVVHDDFVLLRYRDATGEAGALSGFLDEVFRVNRYRVGEGRWTALEAMPGMRVQWAGGDDFVLARESDPSGPAMGL
jgi:hypothetical protein